MHQKSVRITVVCCCLYMKNSYLPLQRDKRYRFRRFDAGLCDAH
jgi:hypothetical protein